MAEPPWPTACNSRFGPDWGECRPPEEQQRLIRAYELEFENFLENRSDANQLIHVGATPPRTEIDPVELAAWTMVAQVLLNLDETITKG